MSKTRLEFSIQEDGKVVAIYNDTIRSLLLRGTAEIRRASHVEPVGTQWQVDLTPIGGPVLDTLFDNREDALEAEVEWLRKNLL